MDAINQCCYTHKGIWTAVAQKGTFEQQYIGELSRHATLPGSEYGDAFSVLETVGFGSKVLVMRTQYGLRDLSTESKRSSMFSHGYLIDMDAENFDPNIFLTISESNFCTDVDSAEAERKELLRTSKYTLHSAMNAAGLTRETYAKLAKCVYQLAIRSVNKQALIIKSESAEQSRALLYCIYVALLPRYAGYLSSASTKYNFSDIRNIVFDKEINSAKKYFVPETGENNVLTANVEKNLDALYFVDYGVKSFDSANTIQDYYGELERTLAQIVDAGHVDDNALKLAHIITVASEPNKDNDIFSDDDELKAIIELASEYKESELVRQYIEKLRSEAIRRGLICDTPPNIPQEESFTRYIERFPVSPVSGRGVQIATTGARTPGSSVSKKISNETPASTGKPLSEKEKQNIKKELEKYASGGAKNFLIFKAKVEGLTSQTGIIKDDRSKDEYVEMICDALCKMVSTSMKQQEVVSFASDPLDCFETWSESFGLDCSGVEKYKNKLVVAYWDNFNWNDFPLLKRTDYNYFRLSSKDRAKKPGIEMKYYRLPMFVDAVSALEKNKSKVEKTEEWLIELNGICFGYEGTFNKEKIHSKLSEYYKNHIIKSGLQDDFFRDGKISKSLVGAAISLTPSEFKRYLSVCREVYVFVTSQEMIKQESDREEEQFLFDLKELVSREKTTPTTREWIIKNTHSLFVEFEKSGHIIPFDFWLALGSGGKESPFRMFYEQDYKPKVMREVPVKKTASKSRTKKEIPVKKIVSESMLLKEDYYVNALLKSEKKNKSPFIKSLIKEIKKGSGRGKEKKEKSILKR